MDIASFIFTVLGFAILCGSTFVGAGLYVGKQIGSLNKAIDRGSGEVKVLTNQIHNLSNNVDTMNEAVSEIHSKVNHHDVRLAVLENSD